MSGKRSRDKGRRTELAIVRLLQDHGLAAEKISRAGYTGADISVPVLGIDRAGEVKCRGAGFKQIYAWLDDDRDFLVIKSDRREALVITRLEFAAVVVAAAERGK